MIDLHSHLLPNIDDGSRSVEQSANVLTGFAEHGVSDVVLTPHIQSSVIDEHGEDIVEERRELFDILLDGVAERPSLHLGFEIMLDCPLPPIAIGDRRYALASSRYYLVEFPYGIAPSAATTALEQLCAAGVTPIVAHPERYPQCDVSSVATWRAAGARIQVDATTLTKGSPRGKQARSYVRAGLADVLAGDNHGDKRALRTGRDYLRTAGYHEHAELLTVANPGAVLSDEPMELVPELGRNQNVFRRWFGRGGI